MPALPAWLPLAVDAVIGITLILFLLHGLRRGLFELSLSTVMLIVNLTVSTLAGIGLSTLNLPYGALITVVGSGLAWILTGMLLRRLLKSPCGNWISGTSPSGRPRWEHFWVWPAALPLCC